MQDGGLRIGQVAKRTGLDVRLIRHYEKIGLIPPLRRSKTSYASAGYRLFTDEDVQRLEFIKLARILDLRLRQIGDLLSNINDGCCASAQPRLRGLLMEKLREVDGQIALLQRLRQRLETYYRRLPNGAKDQEMAHCAPAASPIQCAFGDPSLRSQADNPLTLQRLEGIQARCHV